MSRYKSWYTNCTDFTDQISMSTFKIREITPSVDHVDEVILHHGETKYYFKKSLIKTERPTEHS